jgi:hypothetical protein
MADTKPVKLSANRWAILVRYFDASGPGKFDALQLQTLMIDAPIEAEGIIFLPALYRAA